MNLTKTVIDKLKPSDKATASRPDKLTDGNGLQLLIRPTGTKTWIASYHYQGKNRNITIGRYPAISIREARERNNEIRNTLYRGIDPRTELLEKKKQLSGDYLFKAYAKKYHELQHGKIKAGTYNAMIGLYERYIAPVLDDKAVTAITPLDVLAMAQNTVKQSGIEQARRAVKQAQNIFRLAIIEGLINVNPATDVTMLLPAKPPTVNRARIEAGELHQLLNDINDYNGHESVKIALLLLAHTFVRVSELLSAEWHEIDLDREIWTIPANKMKMNREHVVPLTATTIELFKRLKEISGDSNYLFINKDTGKPYSRVSITKALYSMGYKGQMTSHGFRGIASTVLNDLECKPELIELQLSHVTGNKVSRAYNHAQQLLPRRSLMKKYSDYLNTAMSTEPANHNNLFVLNDDRKLNFM